MSFSLTPSRRPHATKPDCGFVLPPLDGSLSLAQIYDFHYRHNANYTVFIHPTASGDQVELTYKAVVPAIHQAARLAAEIAGLNLDAKPQNIPAIAVLAASGKLSRQLPSNPLTRFFRHHIVHHNCSRNNASGHSGLSPGTALFGARCSSSHFQERNIAYPD